MDKEVSSKEIRQHFEDDKNFQDRIEKWFERAEPMIKAFEDKKITKMVFERETKTVVFYMKQITTIGLFLAGGWAFIKYILIKLILK